MSWEEVLAEVDDYAEYVRRKNEAMRREGA